MYNNAVSDVITNGDQNATKECNTCPSVSITPLQTGVYPKTLTLDFGSGCTYYGVTVKGKIIAVLSDRVRVQGTTISITFDNYQVDTITVGGTVSLTVNSVSLTSISVSETISNGVLTIPSGTITLNCTQSLTWEWQLTPLNYTDDIITISSGNTSYTGLNSLSFTSQVLEPVIIDVGCLQPTDGKVKITTTGISYTATIDFGDGTCDGTATVTTTALFTDGTNHDYTYTLALP
ncbi:MAG: hypothetical protein HY738_08530 [Bacteroidia bacterium]|nr:hypothetical protein [Bacteroidia bacterium]